MTEQRDDEQLHRLWATLGVDLEEDSYRVEVRGHDVVGLNLADLRLEELPDLHAFESLERLTLTHNRLRSLRGVERLSNLQTLNAVDNLLTTIDPVRPLHQLRRLAAGENELEVVDGLSDMGSLEILSLASNRISDFVGNLPTSLSVLDISNNALRGVPRVLEKLELLTSLDLSDNQLDWPDYVEATKAPEALRRLSLAGNPLGAIPSVWRLGSLTTLDLSSVGAQGDVGAMRSATLEVLRLANNGLRGNLDVSGLPELKSLDISLNNLSSIRGLGALPHLQCLYAGGNPELRLTMNRPVRNLETETDVTSDAINKFGRRHFESVHQIHVLAQVRPWSRDMLARYLLDDTVTSFVYIEDGLAVAAMFVRVLRGRMSLEDISVHPDRQRRGIGGKLMVRLVDEAIALGAREITLTVRETNGVARRLYERFAFVDTGKRQLNDWVVTGESAIMMRRALKNL